MNTVVKKLLLYAPAAALGIWCAVLQNRILISGFDHKGLLMEDNPAVMLLWSITGVYLLAVLVLVPLLGGSGDYGDNYPSCTLSGITMILAGLGVAFTGVNAMVPGLILPAALTISVGVLMVVCGVFRMLGKNPTVWPDLLIGVFYAWWLMNSYSGWNANPHVQRYAFHLLAGVAVRLFTLHRARMAGGYPVRKRLLFFGFAGILLSFAAMPGVDYWMHFVATGLWCAGGMCDLNKLKIEN